MTQKLLVYQSLWAMDGGGRSAGMAAGTAAGHDPRRRLRRRRRPLHRSGFAAEVTSFLRDHGMIWQAQCYPQSVDDLKPVLELVARLGADHVNLQPDVRPHRLEPNAFP